MFIFEQFVKISRILSIRYKLIKINVTKFTREKKFTNERKFQNKNRDREKSNENTIVIKNKIIDYCIEIFNDNEKNEND